MRLQNRLGRAAPEPVWGRLALPWECGEVGAGHPAVPSLSLWQEGIRAGGLVEDRGDPRGALRTSLSIALASCGFSLLGGGQD